MQWRRRRLGAVTRGTMGSTILNREAKAFGTPDCHNFHCATLFAAPK